MPNAAQSPKKSQKKKPSPVKKEIIYLCSCCAAVFVLLLAGFNLKSGALNTKVLGAKAENEENEIALKSEVRFWDDFLKQNPTYLSGWVELARINYKLGKIDQASYASEKAKEINPNAPGVKDLEKEF